MKLDVRAPPLDVTERVLAEKYPEALLGFAGGRSRAESRHHGLTERMLAPYGGFLFDGHRQNASPERRKVL